MQDDQVVMVRIKPGLIDFPNGWGIDVHKVQDGEVYFQRWPPGVESQGMFTNLMRSPLYAFAMMFMSEDGVYMGDE